MPAAFVHGHFAALELVQLLANGRLIFGRQSRPRLVGTSIVVVRLRHLDVIVEADDLFLFQFINRWPEAELSQ